jgi:HD-like signal output (HDOD) protein
MGIQRLRDLVISDWFHRTLPSRLAGYGVLATEFWAHNVASAVFAQAIARRAGTPQSDAFTAGLLHDCGKLAIATILQDRDVDLTQRLVDSATPFIDVEHDILGVDHSKVGKAIIDGWDLPEVLSLAARYHHHPMELAGGDDASVVAAVHVASVLAHTIGCGADVGGLRRVIFPGALERLGVEERELEQIVEESFGQVRAMVEAFG